MTDRIHHNNAKPTRTITSRHLASCLPAAGLALAGIMAAGAATAQSPTDAFAHPNDFAPMESTMGQADLAIEDPRGFGNQDRDVATIGWTRFLPEDDATGYNNGSLPTISRAVDAGAADTQLWAEITPGDVPNGAFVSQIAFYVNDADSTNEIQAWYCQFIVDSGSGDNYGGPCQQIGVTSGTPGETTIFDSVDRTLLRRTDEDNDGTTEVVTHYLLFWPQGDAGEDQSIQMARVLWERQVSPAPGTATFGDVPTGHIFFQSVEAMADAGITGGCGGGNFCPNDNVTRGQMAAFLARALGLHWPSGL